MRLTLQVIMCRTRWKTRYREVLKEFLVVLTGIKKEMPDFSSISTKHYPFWLDRFCRYKTY
jgi:hypothetical protein